jgi:PmbA protein
MSLTVDAVDMATDGGADAAEALITDSRSVQVQVSDRAVEQVNAVSDAGIGVRILKDQKMIFGSSNDLARESVNELISGLLSKVVYHTPDEFNVIPGREFGPLEGDWSAISDLVPFDATMAEVPIEEKIEKTILLDVVGRGVNQKITGSMTVLYQDESGHMYLANSNGIAGHFPRSSWAAYAEFIAADGDDRQSGSHFDNNVRYEEFDPEAIARRAAQNALRMLGAEPLESCELPMVVDPTVAAGLFEYISGMLSADMVQKGRSLFADKIDEQVASDSVTLVDDGLLEGGLATSPVDGEGIPRQRTPLIVNGVLASYLYDCYTAKKGNCPSTGNRSRSDYQSAGGIGTTNLVVEAGAKTPEEVFSAIGDGFYLTEAFGLHAGVDPTSGDYSLPAAGFRIENGALTSPIRGISIGGNLFELLGAVDDVCNDVTWVGSTACPTISVTSVKIGGV